MPKVLENLPQDISSKIALITFYLLTFILPTIKAIERSNKVT